MLDSDNNYYFLYVCDTVLKRYYILYNYICVYMMNKFFQSCKTEFCLLRARIDLITPADEDAPDLLLL
jgi:hypothetical protein